MISVVIPLYNKAQSIVTTIQSVLNQSFLDYEIVVVDDGSTDGSADKVLAISCDQIRLIRKANGGVSSARNAGILAARGEYVAFLDGDDWWAPDYLEELMLLISMFPDAGLYGISYMEVATINDIQIPDNANAIVRRRVDNPWKERLDFFTSSICATRENLIKVGLFDERMAYGEDLDMWYRLLLFAGGAVSTRCLAFYVQGAENRAMNKIIPLEKHILSYMDKYADARLNNIDFRRFFDQEMVWRIYPYLFIEEYQKKVNELSKQIDYGCLKKSMWFRIRFPHLYKLYMLCLGRKIVVG